MLSLTHELITTSEVTLQALHNELSDVTMAEYDFLFRLKRRSGGW